MRPHVPRARVIDYLRAALPDLAAAGSTLGQDATLARACLEIMRLRTRSSLVFDLQIPIEMRNTPFPAMVLLPLLTTTIGQPISGDALSVHIRVSKDAGRTRIAITRQGTESNPVADSQAVLAIRDRLENPVRWPPISTYRGPSGARPQGCDRDHKPAASTIALAFVLSSIALSWSYVFNTFFERWESRQPVRGRSLARRIVHGIGFEGGLVFILVPVMALWLDTSILHAFMANLGIMAFFFLYAVASPGRLIGVFGLPESAVKQGWHSHPSEQVVDAIHVDSSAMHPRNPRRN